MRHRPAHSIRARELVSQIQAECKGAFFTRDPEPKISLGMQGRPCKGRPCKLSSGLLSRDAVLATAQLHYTSVVDCAGETTYEAFGVHEARRAHRVPTAARYSSP